VPLLRRSATPAQSVTTDTHAGDVDAGLDVLAWARLRDEVDPDPLVEEAVDRMRSALTSLEARDDWGRPLAWRHVARIALGPLVTRLRDIQTTAALLDATRPAPEEPRAALPSVDEMPFWPA
jgi:hypothetical protein